MHGQAWDDAASSSCRNGPTRHPLFDRRPNQSIEPAASTTDSFPIDRSIDWCSRCKAGWGYAEPFIRLGGGAAWRLANNARSSRQLSRPMGAARSPFSGLGMGRASQQDRAMRRWLALDWESIDRRTLRAIGALFCFPKDAKTAWKKKTHGGVGQPSAVRPSLRRISQSIVVVRIPSLRAFVRGVD